MDIKYDAPVGIVSGPFDIIHEGHLDYIRAAKEYIGKNGQLIAIVNFDDYVIGKHGYVALPLKSRMAIVSAIRWVDEVCPCYDHNVSRVLQDIYERRQLRQQKAAYSARHPIYFFNSGDRDPTNWNEQEKEVCSRLGIQVRYLDLPKVDSSSSIKTHIFLAENDKLEKYINSLGETV